jgi:hypothetical protein
MDDFETGRVENRSLKSRVLIATDNKRVQCGRLHAGANVPVSAINFFLTWQYDLSRYSLTSHNSAAVSA